MTPMVINCIFTGNHAAQDGGGMFNSGGIPTVTGCKFAANSAIREGGGMHNNESTGEVTNCTFTGNSGGSGGGMANTLSSPWVINCIFTGNTADAGGGMVNLSGDPDVTNCTFTGNSARTLGGMFDGSSLPKVTNCILWGNIGGEMSTVGPRVTYSDVQGGYPGVGNINADPLFVNAAGGNYQLQSNAPCIDKGSAAAPHLPATDLDGLPRIIGSAPDMGAYEFKPFVGWYVDKATGSDSNSGSSTAPFKTVTKAVTVAINGDNIYIKQGSYGTDTPRITKALHLYNWLNTGLVRIGQP